MCEQRGVGPPIAQGQRAGGPGKYFFTSKKGLLMSSESCNIAEHDECLSLLDGADSCFVLVSIGDCCRSIYVPTDIVREMLEHGKLNDCKFGVNYAKTLESGSSYSLRFLSIGASL